MVSCQHRVSGRWVCQAAETVSAPPGDGSQAYRSMWENKIYGRLTENGVVLNIGYFPTEPARENMSKLRYYTYMRGNLNIPSYQSDCMCDPPWRYSLADRTKSMVGK